MSVKPCTLSYMLATVDGLGMARHFYTRVVAEVMLESKKDGEIQRCPDPVTMIDGDLTWYNNTKDPQIVGVHIQRGPRSIVAQSPATVLIRDAWTHAVGVNRTADYPSFTNNACGGKLQIDRSSTAAADIQFGRVFYDYDDEPTWENVGQVDPGEALHFRYLCAVHTPGVWTTPGEGTPKWETKAQYARLRAWAGPVTS